MIGKPLFQNSQDHTIRLEECKIGRVLNWKSERLDAVRLDAVGLDGVGLDGVGLKGCKIGRVKDWKSERLEECMIRFEECKIGRV